jgi:hypothetical protein
MKKLKHILFWILAIAITLSAAMYQRTTGPTYPKKVEANFSDVNYKFKLIRSQEIGKACHIDVDVNGDAVEAKLFYKRLGVDEAWTENILENRTKNARAFFGDGEEMTVLSTVLPEQPEAGKLQYFIELRKNNEVQFIAKEKPIVIRFKGHVPAYILAPHVLFMFIAMLLASITGIYFLAKDYKRTRYYGIRTFIALFLGGMVLGPIVQKFAFSEFWTGIPFGWDLTDNKTLIAFVAWTIAFLVNIKSNKRPILWLIATLVLYIIYTIPHSAYGSEFDYATGKVTQGFIMPLLGIF